MPRFSHPESLVTGLEPIGASDLWGVDIVDPASAHAGVWHAGLVATYFVIHDFSPYHGWEGEIDIFDIPPAADWEFRIIGAAYWIEVTYTEAGLSQANLGTNTPTWNNIIAYGGVASGVKTFRGDLDAHMNLGGGKSRTIGPGGSIKMYWSTNADTTMAGCFAMGVWGYLIPDITVAGS